MNTLVAFLSVIPILFGAMFQQGDLIRYPVNVEAAVMNASPEGAYMLAVTGTETLSCEFDMTITQSYENGTVIVEIYEEATAAVTCIAQVIPYNETITLDVPDGAVLNRVIVNSFEVDITPQQDTPITPTNANEIPELPQSVFGELSYALIESVEVNNGENGLELTISGIQMGDCLEEQVIIQEVSDNWLRVSIYCDPSPMATLSCLLIMGNFEVTVPVDPAFDPQIMPPYGVVVEVNDYIAFLRNEAGINLSLTETERELLFVENVMPVIVDSVDAENATVEVSIAAQPADGCDIPYNTRQLSRTDPFMLQVYRPLVTDVQACPLILRTYDFTYPLTLPDALEDGQYTLSVNNLDTLLQVGEPTMSNDTPNNPRPTPVATVIETVNVNIMESFPPQLSVEITGYHPDGCDFPVMEQSEIVGDQIYVSIFREVPADVMCTQNIVPYSTTISLGTINPGTYTLYVNDYVTEVQID